MGAVGEGRVRLVAAVMGGFTTGAMGTRLGSVGWMAFVSGFAMGGREAGVGVGCFGVEAIVALAGSSSPASLFRHGSRSWMSPLFCPLSRLTCAEACTSGTLAETEIRPLAA